MALYLGPGPGIAYVQKAPPQKYRGLDKLEFQEAEALPARKNGAQ